MISVIIPVYKNTELFIKNLEHNLRHLKDCQIIIINDDPVNSIKKELGQIKFPNLILIENQKNLGFGESVNRGARQATGKYLMLLNSDVLLNDQSYLEAMEDFNKLDNLFAVSFAQKEKKGNLVGKNIVYWQQGLFNHQKNTDLVYGINAWAEGGTCIIDKDKFNRLNGFDPLYSPFYWEDIDLSYRAWKSGYRIVFNPKITVIHHHESTINKYFDSAKIRTVAYRNQLIFSWKNATDLNLRVKFFLFLPLWLVRSSIRGDSSFLRGFWGFLCRLPKIIKTAALTEKEKALSDKKVLSFFKV